MSGEGFAFFRWALSLIPDSICRPPVIGWGCSYCRRDWDKLQGRIHGA